MVTKKSTKKKVADGLKGTEEGIDEFDSPSRSLTFEKYIEMIKAGKNFKQEPSHIEDDNCVVYVIGDLEGDYNILYRWLLHNKFIDTDLQWIAPKNVYVVQCGDQLDNGINAPHKRGYTFAMFPFFLRRNQVVDYFTFDMYLVLFMDYLSIISNHHVLSVLGNHEMLNVGRDFRYVNLSNFKSKYSHNQLYQMFATDHPQYQSLYQDILNGIRTPVVNYLERRRRLLEKDGIFGKILRRRNFIIKFNNLLISHAGITNTSISTYSKNIDDSDFDIDNFINYTNRQIRLKMNWTQTKPYTDVDFNFYYNVIKTGGEKWMEDWVLKFNNTIKPTDTELFKMITKGQETSIVWNRNYATTKDRLDCLPSDFSDYIIVTGHNADTSIKCCNCTGGPCSSALCSSKPDWIMVDSGRSGKLFPSLDSAKIKYVRGNIVYPIDIINFPTIEPKTPDDIKEIKNVKEIEKKLGITSYTLDNFIALDGRSKRRKDGRSKRKSYRSV